MNENEKKEEKVRRRKKREEFKEKGFPQKRTRFSPRNISFLRINLFSLFSNSSFLSFLLVLFYSILSIYVSHSFLLSSILPSYLALRGLLLASLLFTSITHSCVFERTLGLPFNHSLTSETVLFHCGNNVKNNAKKGRHWSNSELLLKLKKGETPSLADHVMDGIDFHQIHTHTLTQTSCVQLSKLDRTENADLNRNHSCLKTKNDLNLFNASRTILQRLNVSHRLTLQSSIRGGWVRKSRDGRENEG